MDGHFRKDTIPPELISLDLVHDSSMLLGFSEIVQLSETSSFVLFAEDLPMGETPVEVLEQGEKILIRFSEVLQNRKLYELRIAGVEDTDGNPMADTVVPVMRSEALWGDVVFNELMADPDPAVCSR